MSRASTPSSGPSTTSSPAAASLSANALSRAPVPDSGAGRTCTRSAPPSVVKASRPRATSRSPELTKSSTPSSWSHAPQRRSSAWPMCGPGTTTTAPTPWVRAVTSSWSSMPMRTGTGHSSASCVEVPIIGGLRQADGHRTERRPGSTAVRLPQHRPHSVAVTHHEGGDRRPRGHEAHERARQGGHGRHRRGEDQGSGGQLPGVAVGGTRRHDQQDPQGRGQRQRGPEQSPSCDAVRICARTGIPAGKRYGRRPGDDHEHVRRRHPCREDQVHKTGCHRGGQDVENQVQNRGPAGADGPGRSVLRVRDGHCRRNLHRPRRERRESPPPWTCAQRRKGSAADHHAYRACSAAFAGRPLIWRPGSPIG